MNIQVDIQRHDGHVIRFSAFPEQYLVKDVDTSESRGYSNDGIVTMISKEIIKDFSLQMYPDTLDSLLLAMNRVHVNP